MTDNRTPEQIALWEQAMDHACVTLIRPWIVNSYEAQRQVAAALLRARANEAIRFAEEYSDQPIYARARPNDLLAALPPGL